MQGGKVNMAGLFNTTSFRLMEQGRAFLDQQRKIISHNITNIDTPDYKSKYLTFSGVLREKMQSNHKFQHELHLKTHFLVDEDTKGQPDGNNVDYELQAALLKQNALWSAAVTNQIESEFNMMRSAMRRS